MVLKPFIWPFYCVCGPLLLAAEMLGAKFSQKGTKGAYGFPQPDCQASIAVTKMVVQLKILPQKPPKTINLSI
jgi:hypothetical protein